jgi:hypothetical protein
MKRRVTIKYLKALYGSRAIQLSYCEMQNLFKDSEADYYTCGVYGWNFDGFCVGGAVVTTGYRSMFGVEPSCELVQEYENKAIELNKQYYTNSNYNELREKMYILRKEFVNKVLNK